MANKVIFDPLTKTIKFKAGITSIDFQQDVYSDGKEDWLTNASLNKYIFPVRSIGGNLLSSGKIIEPTFFLLNGWQLEPDSRDHEIYVFGNIFHDDGIPVVKVPSGYAIVVNMSTTISPDTGDPAIVKRASEDNIYRGAVTIDIDSEYFGTAYPTGTPSFPVNNVSDAITIANSRGFTTLNIKTSMEINSGNNIENFTLIGNSRVVTSVLMADSTFCKNVTIKDCNVFGILDGGVQLENCSVGDISYVNGQIRNCGLYGQIYLDGDEKAVISNCYTIDQDSYPIVDMGGNGQSLAMPNYSGMVLIKNLDAATEEIGIGLDSGMIILDSTISSGTIVVAGVGLLQNYSTGTAMVNADGLISNNTITSTILNAELNNYTTEGTLGNIVLLVKKILTNQSVDNGATIDIYDDDNITILGTFTWNEATGTRGKFA